MSSGPGYRRAACDELSRLAPGFQNASEARLMARHLAGKQKQFRSFRASLDGIERPYAAMPQEENAS
jgi:hypothetical protein